MRDNFAVNFAKVVSGRGGKFFESVFRFWRSLTWLFAISRGDRLNDWQWLYAVACNFWIAITF